MSDFQIIRAIGGAQEVRNDSSREVRNPRHALIIDLVGLVGRAMVIFVAAGEEMEHRHAFGIKGGNIGWEVGIILQRQVEPGGDVASLDQLAPER